MHDIFLSYAREDRDYARTLTQALEKEGFDVWWDRIIPTGKSFDVVIQNAIDNSNCIIVLWSTTSVKSDWVKEEAAIGKQRKSLIPILINDVPIPLGFGRSHTANLIDWNYNNSDDNFQLLIKDIRLLISETENEKRLRKVEKDKKLKDELFKESTKISKGLYHKKLIFKRTSLIAVGLILVAYVIWKYKYPKEKEQDKLEINQLETSEIDEQLTEINIWNDALIDNVAYKYENYIKKYPGGIYVSEAKDSILKIRNSVFEFLNGDKIFKPNNVIVLSINSNSQLTVGSNFSLVNSEMISINSLRNLIIEFLDNNGDGSCDYCKGAQLSGANASDNPKKAFILINKDKNVTNADYISIINELVAAYNQLRDRRWTEELKRLRLGFPFIDMDFVELQKSYPRNQDVKMLEVRNVIKSIIADFPQNIMEYENDSNNLKSIN